MIRLTKRTTTRTSSERGAALVEYVLLAALIAMAGVISVKSFGQFQESKLIGSADTFCAALKLASNEVDSDPTDFGGTRTTCQRPGGNKDK